MTVRIWDSETGEVLATLEGHRGGVNSVSLSPDNTQLVTGSGDNTARVWDLSAILKQSHITQNYK